MFFMNMAGLQIRDKHIKKLAKALQEAGLMVSITKNNHVRVENPETHKVVFFGANSLGDWRAAKNIRRDLKIVGFDAEKIG